MQPSRSIALAAVLAALPATGQETALDLFVRPDKGHCIACHQLPAGVGPQTRADVGPPPYIRMEDNFTWWTVGATIAVDAAVTWELGLSAVLEEQDGAKSYWALAHTSPAPDFHDPGCFIARLP